MIENLKKKKKLIICNFLTNLKKVWKDIDKSVKKSEKWLKNWEKSEKIRQKCEEISKVLKIFGKNNEKC